MNIIITCYNRNVLDYFINVFCSNFSSHFTLVYNTNRSFFETIISFNPLNHKHIFLYTNHSDKEIKFNKSMFCPHLFINVNTLSYKFFTIINEFLDYKVFIKNSFINEKPKGLNCKDDFKTKFFPAKKINKLLFNKHLIPLTSNNKILILGNGPSLKNIDFMNINIPTMGMNSAYRFWEKYNWFPDFYISMDDKLIESHHREMNNLIIEKKVRSAFFNDCMFEKWQPILKKHPRVFSFGRIGKSKFFKSTNDNKMTTGAWAVRFAAYLGFSEIYLAGIDCNYVEIIPEATLQDDNSLIINKTPDNNPNYFFSDYQRKGDKYNIPNPTVHSGRLHIDSFKVLKNDISVFNMGISVYNMNKYSKLEEESIFTLQENINILER